MRDGWEVEVLGSLCDVLDNQRKPITKKNRVAGDYPYYGATGILDYVDGFLFDENLILIGEDGAKWGTGENTAFSADGEYWVNNHAHVIRPRRDRVLDQWIIYYLNGNDLSEFITGMTVPKLNQGKLKGIPIPLPPLAEQKRIVGVLDEVSGAIGVGQANAQKNLANASELFETTLNNIFTKKGEGWVEKRLEEITTKIGSGATPKGGASAYKSVGISLIRSLNVYDRHFTEKKLAFIDDGQSEKLSNVVVEVGDVLFNITGASIARCCVAPSEYLPARVNQHVSILRPKKDQISTEFLCYLMTSRRYKEQLFGIGDDGGSTRQAITKKQLQDLKVAVPKDIEAQKSIVLKLDNLGSQTQHLEAIYQQKLDDLSELKQSILHKAFAGELSGVATTTPEFTANVICLAHFLHAKEQRERTFGRVKAQKNLHLSESIGGIELGRQPIKDAAGPNDSAHMRSAENWAKEQQFFEFVKKPVGRGYDFKKLPCYDEMKAKALAMLKPYRGRLEKVTRLLINKDTEQAAVFATVHAAWNNLILDGIDPTDDAIIFEARENWHADKLNIDKSKFKTAIAEIKRRMIIPDGSTKYVGRRQESFL